MKPSDLQKPNTRAVYPWPIERPNIPDITGLELDEILYGLGPNKNEMKESSFIIGGSSIGDNAV